MTMLRIKTMSGIPDAGYTASDGLRHRPLQGDRMRDSLFWQTTLAELGLGFQAYAYVSAKGNAGYNVAIWGNDPQTTVLARAHTEVSDDIDFGDFQVGELNVRQLETHRSNAISYSGRRITFELEFKALHDPFSYRQNPCGLPPWFALNRIEQTGWLSGFLELDGQRIPIDRIGHRDHSWGVRNWGLPHHWKWAIAYTPHGDRIVNIWIWIAKGEWGFGGYVVRDNQLVPVDYIKHAARYDAAMGQEHLLAEIIDVKGHVTQLELTRFGILKLPTPGRYPTLISEAACTALIDGAVGSGQFETHWSQTYLDHLVRSGRQE